MTKTVYAFDRATGAFTVPVDLGDSDKSPLEDDVYLIPGGCLEAVPPTPPSGQWPFVVDGEWVLQMLSEEPEPEPAPTPTLEERAAALLRAVDAHLNVAARARGYDSIITAALRAGYPGPFHDEGMAFAIWMDSVYAKCYELLAQVQAGEIAEPTAEQLIVMLPAPGLPT
ncbi:hypothetical protein [Variovorax sp. IB41]|uniref:hypothetical protein n=1 Tax=Variovorax sp. IB41 TaxID=2779370 RepID=UPI0018E7876C|nr:hypothetical protein [Variovorax sp. IB41]MBJ2155257.1 hypothetical protein [Variovorax sp. IB41]